MLSEEDIDRFVRDGFVKVAGAFPRQDADAAAAHLLALAQESQAGDGARSPVVRIGGSEHPAVVSALNTDRIVGCIDDLVGPGHWERREGYGTFPVRFPSAEDPGDAGWHIDGSFGDPPHYRVNLASRGRALLALVLFTDVGVDDAPTRILAGSHRHVARSLVGAGDVMFSPADRVPQVLDLSVVRATGQAGTIYLCHPFLVHAASWPHRGVGPRVIGQPAIHHPEGAWRGGFDYERPPDSPVKKAVRLALTEP